jgi:hypothetical protein
VLRIAAAAQPVAEVIKDDEHDVGFPGCRGMGCVKPDKRRKQQGGEECEGESHFDAASPK